MRARCRPRLRPRPRPRAGADHASALIMDSRVSGSTRVASTCHGAQRCSSIVLQSSYWCVSLYRYGMCIRKPLCISILAHPITICQAIAVNLPSKNTCSRILPQLSILSMTKRQARSTRSCDNSVSFSVCRSGVAGVQFRFFQATQLPAFRTYRSDPLST